MNKICVIVLLWMLCAGLEAKEKILLQNRDAEQWTLFLEKAKFSPHQARVFMEPLLLKFQKEGDLGLAKKYYWSGDLRAPSAIVGEYYFYNRRKLGMKFEGFYFHSKTGVLEYRKSNFSPQSIPKSIDLNKYSSISDIK